MRTSCCAARYFACRPQLNGDILPWTTFTDPELAHVGLTEDMARQRFDRIRVLRWPFHENDKAQTERATDGFVKVITDAKGRIRVPAWSADWPVK